MTARRRLVRTAAFLLFNVIVAAAIVEVMFVTVLNTPALAGAMPRNVRLLFQQVYRHFNRSIIQFEPACSQYDPELTYVLKPGQCTFENVEFRTEFAINRVGLRDDEAALEAPDVIVLGDSHTMGWGVNQDETYSQVLARSTGLKVLNAGVSSYGTVREMRLLGRLDTSRMKTLVVQYDSTDAVENWVFRERGGTLQTLSAAQYQETVDWYVSQRGYWPGKYIYRLFTKLSRLEAPQPHAIEIPPLSTLDEAELFVNALAGAGGTPLDGVKVIVFEANEQIRPPRSFLANVAVVSRRDGQPEFIRTLHALDVARVLEESDFYDLDDHMRPSGHDRIGRVLAELVRTP
jgi:hypothetical protein